MSTSHNQWWYRVPLGVALGLAASAVVLAILPGGGSGDGRREHGRLLSECDGTIRELVIHYVPDAADAIAPIYRDFLRQLPGDVLVHVVCRDRAAFDDLTARVAPIDCSIVPVIVDHPITGWSRDRWLALRAYSDGPLSLRERVSSLLKKGTGSEPSSEIAEENGLRRRACPLFQQAARVRAQPPIDDADKTVLLCPQAENGADVWPDRAGDRRVAGDLAAALRPKVSARSSELYFDGGDVAADGETAFVTPAMPLRNIQRTVADADELRERLAAMLGRRVVLLHDAPDHHTAMYMTPVGNRTLLVGDPAWARRLLVEAGRERDAADWFPGGPDFSDATIARFNAVARQCQALGYRVVRIPVLPGCDGRTFLTYVNAIIDQRAGRHIVYMPTFSFADELNRAAAQVWRDLGYEVKTVRCDACYRYFGTLHCLVNVLRRDP
jgi:hypothetical protein